MINTNLTPKFGDETVKWVGRCHYDRLVGSQGKTRSLRKFAL